MITLGDNIITLHTPREKIRSPFPPKHGGSTHTIKMMALGKSHRPISLATSLRVYTLPLVEKTNFEVRPRGGVILSP